MSEKDKPKWDGRSRPTNNLYKKNYDEIFKEEYTPEELKEEQELADFADKFKEKEDKHEKKSST